MPLMGHRRFEMKPFAIRLLLWAVVAVASAFVLYLTISYAAIPLLIWLSPTLNPTLYDLGFYGGSPSQTYISNGLSSPRVSISKYDPNCDKGYTFLNYNGGSMPNPGPAILDSNSELVWKGQNFDVTTNLKVQSYMGQQYLTFWSGKKGGTMGKGVYYMLDSSYEIKHTVAAVARGSDIEGDLHEFKITKDNTALLTFYNITPADLSSLGKWKNGWVTDSGFQEVDIATGELLFEWKASEHFQVNETFMTHPFGGYIKSIPFDFFHINSVDKDSKGNYLISSRHTHTVTCISPDGEIMWILGGQRNQFKDLSGGDALNFRWQHDARWLDEQEGILTLFDNKEGGPLHVDGPYSRALMLQLDIANRTVTLLHSYISQYQTRTPSQGSAQYLPDSRHVFVGFGHSPVLSEFSLDGTLLCEVHYGAPWLHVFTTAVSYRAYRSADWVGEPRQPPAATILDDILYVSWNGATEVVAWVLQGGGTGEQEEEEWTDLDFIDKQFFEESFDLSQLSQYSQFRVGALGREGQILGYSDIAPRESSGSWWGFLLAVFLWGLASKMAWMGYKWFSQHKGASKRGVSWVVWKKS
ncbi:hypothetical protein Z517_10379 [Fonsecaea pedrosoi CBS 271.37]|uniref:Unplaced genomic scaffold supercont1.7, whole genome shotgun sequence n=1 Tax=Fonsecaea pedrosoi CBS 271.37 TaxID=1442368 RepID=A0A0D2EML5_9EURO|nr:uncharacterized protein Z517_10379 [Fonsecaea pedrosoi CBS 271.37]KIW75637.1 hypothetical protein Z517_10379 [Fonsecaea pedrosoi CBS 271.37]